MLAPRAASGQVNAETFRSDLKDQPYFVSIDGSVTGNIGNTQGIVVGAALFAGLRRGDHLLFGKAQGDYTAYGGVTSVFKSFAHIRYNYQIRSWLYAEVFSQVQQDKFQALALRNVDGVGPRFSVAQTKVVDLFYGTSYMFEYEVLSPGYEVLNSKREKQPPQAHRWNNYLSIMVNIDDRTRFTSVLYVQPRFDDFKNVRVLNESSFGVKLKSSLSLKFGVVARYDSAPPQDPPKKVLPVDLEAKNSLSVTF
jgi:hypothetical protein